MNLLNFITMNQAGISLWGLLPQGQLPTLITLFYVGLVALFASVILWRTLAVRFYRRSTVALWMIALASAIVLVTAGSYSVQVSAANQQVLDEDRYRNDRFEVIKLPRDMPFAVTAYDLTFAPGAPARLSATMQIVNRSNATIRELLFSLYRQFDIIEASVPFTRQDGTFTLTLPEAIEPSQSARVRVNYEGNIQYLERRLGRPPEATYFIHPNGVNLACPLLWYPVPGSVLPNTTYYDEYFVGHPHCLLDTPSRMRLTVHGSSSLQYVSNLTQVSPAVFESAGATWAQLIGAAELQTISSEAVTVVAAGPQTAEIASLVTEYYPPAFEHIRRFFPEAAHLTVFALNLGADSFSQWDDYPATAEGAIVVIDPRYLPWLRANPENEHDFVGRPMVSSILGQGTTLAENIAYFLWIHYRANGDNAAMRTMLENGLPAGERGRVTYYSVPYRERYQIAFALFDMYEAHGEAGIIDLIAKIRANLEALNGLPPEQVVAWIEEAANAD